MYSMEENHSITTMANTEGPVSFAKEGDADYFKEVELDVLLNSRSKFGGSVLCVAAAYGHLNCCQVIYKRCPQLLYQANNQGCTPLHEAAYFGEYDVVEFLLCARGMTEQQEEVVQQENEAGEINEVIVDYELLLMVDHDEETALHAATESGYLHSVKLLLEADHSNQLLRMATCKGETALHIAVKKQDSDIVELLVEMDTEHIYPPDKSGHTPLSIALQEALSGDQIAVAIRKFLIRNQPDQCEVPICGNGWTLLHYATFEGDLDSIEEIIHFYPECLELVDDEGHNFFHLAAKFEHQNIVRYILGLTNINDYILNAQDIYGNTALHIAISRGNVNVGLSLLYDPRVKKFLVNKQGKSALDGINFEYDKRRAGVYGFIDRVDEKYLKDRSDFDLLVGALIATVSFTVGLTVPGGFFNDGQNLGYAVLYKKRSFQAFVVSNTIALAFSLSAVFSHFCTKHFINEDDIIFQLKVATSCSLGAIYAMMVVFITGSYAVLLVSDELAITVCVICGCFFLFTFLTLRRMIRQQRPRRPILSTRHSKTSRFKRQTRRVSSLT